MNRLIFVNMWEDRKNAWSGTPDGLYTALSEKLRIVEIDAVPSAAGGKLREKLDLATCFSRRIRESEKKLAGNREIGPDDPLFVFGEFLTGHVGNTYCYQDMSIEYLLRLRQRGDPAAALELHPRTPEAAVRMRARHALAFYRQCAGIFTMSEWLREFMIGELGLPAEKVHCVGGGSNIDVTKADGRGRNGRRFLFVGKAWERKNGPLVAEAFAKLRAEHPDAEMYIAGPESVPESVTRAEGVRFLGTLTHDELIRYYNLCDYFVMPSRFEAYGLVFAEALCFGLPCIGKNLCAMPEFIRNGENGYLIGRDDAEELAQTMRRMLAEGARLKENVRAEQTEILKKYSWASVADRILNVIERDGYDVRKHDPAASEQER